MQPKMSSSRLAEEPGKGERKGGKITSSSLYADRLIPSFRALRILALTSCYLAISPKITTDWRFAGSVSCQSNPQNAFCMSKSNCMSYFVEYFCAEMFWNTPTDSYLASLKIFSFAVNTKAFLVKKEEDIREDELFFHRYCQRSLMSRYFRSFLRCAKSPSNWRKSQNNSLLR